MRKRMKKILAVMLASSLTVGLFPGAVQAEESASAGAQTESAADNTLNPGAVSQERAQQLLADAKTLGELVLSSDTTVEESPEATAARRSAESRSVDWDGAKDDVEQNIFLEPQATGMDISSYGLETDEAEALTNQVLAENYAEDLVDVQVVSDTDGQADAITYSMDPALKAASEEVTTLADEGTTGDEGSTGDTQTPPAGIDEETQQTILQMYAGYQAWVNGQPDYFGIQTPFYTQKESETDKWYGPLRSLFVTAMIPDAGVDAGMVDAQTITGMIMMFWAGYASAVDSYGDELLAAIQEGVSQVDDSMTTIQKLLVLNDWLAEKSTFDMGMLMGMTAPEPAASPVPDELPDSFPMKEQLQQAWPTMKSDVEGLWKGSQFGPLVLGTGVCLGYANAYTLLVQNAFPEIYKNEDGTWKTQQDVNFINKEVTATDADGEALEAGEDGTTPTTTESVWDPSAPYMVDYVRITYDASITMFGEEQDKFDSDHYWNAVKVDGQWYYVDPCYTDIYIECMIRERVETDGNMNHLYFMISDPTVRQLYEGNFSNIDTLYQNLATDKTYESSWLPFIKSPVDVVDGKYYYFYDSTDVISLLNQFGGMMGGNGVSTQAEGDSQWGDLGGDFMSDSEYKLVYHDGSLADNSKDYTELVNFTDGTVLNPTSGQMEENELIKELYARHQTYQSIYPSVQISGSVYNGLFYFNIANTICTYNLSTGEVKQILEYNEVSAKRDLSKTLGGMGFTVVANDSEDKDVTLYNKPIASMTIKNDGNMYISVATNLGWISGKTDMNDQENLGYAFEESNYNPGYNAYFNYGGDTNDNDEFMWSANLVDVKSMSELTGDSHNFQPVTVAPSCETEGYTQNRCADCGLIEGTDKQDVVEPVGHHFVKMDETYYTKVQDSNEFNTGTTYVCPRCLLSKDELEEGDSTDHQYGLQAPSYEWTDDHSACTATFECDACKPHMVDCLQGVDVPTDTVACKITTKYADGFDCSAGGDVTYTATAEAGGRTWSTEETVTVPAGQHVAVYTNNGDGTHSAKCEVCGKVLVENEECTYDENGVCTVCGGKEVSVTYMSHVQTYGDQSWVADGALSGTSGQSKRMEAIKIKLDNATADDHIKYKAHVQGIGWQDWVQDGEIAGTEAQSKRVEAIQIKLEGPIAEKYDVYYRVHAQQFGWLDWAKNGESAGTAGYSYRLEAFQVALVEKGGDAPTIDDESMKPAVDKAFVEKLVSYSVHVQTYGDQPAVWDGQVAGTTGESKRLESIKINLPTNDGKSHIQYRTHVQTYGWEDGWKKDGQLSGTTGQSKRLEAIQIKLSGDMADKYDVYYCVHAQKLGWLGWAKNGESAGTAGYSYRLEGIKIMLVEKGADAPAPVEGAKDKAFYEK